MVTIKTFEQEKCLLFDSLGNYKGEVVGLYSINDVLIQIKEQKLKGYYFVWNNQKIEISEFGKITKRPEGFCTTLGKQVRKLI